MISLVWRTHAKYHGNVIVISKHDEKAAAQIYLANYLSAMTQFISQDFDLLC